MVEFALDLVKQGYPLNIFVNDTSNNTAGFWVSDIVEHFITPKVENDEQKYIDILFDHCLKNEINVIIPLMDFEIPVLSLKKDIFKEKNIEVIVSDYETVVNCLDKQKNYEFCKSKNINIPKTVFKKNKDTLEYPLVLKRILGSGSEGQKIIENEKELVLFRKGRDLLQRFIDGKEYGMDILNDLNGNYLHSFTREKLLMRNGETDKAKAVFSNKFSDLAKEISQKFRHVGNIDIDFIEDIHGEIYFIDFNPRFGGGYPFTHISGYNYLKTLLDIIIGNPIKFPNKMDEIIFMKGISIHSNSEAI